MAEIRVIIFSYAIYCRIPEKKLFKHGIWMIAMKINDFPITKNPRSLSHWINLLVSLLLHLSVITYIYILIVEFALISNFWTLTRVNNAELGVLSWKLDADNSETDPELKKIREERGYSYSVSDANVLLSLFRLNYLSLYSK